MAEFKLGYKHYPKDLAKFKPVDKDDDLTNLRFGNISKSYYLASRLPGTF
ncbi:hypothetical protein [Gilliamella sp. wkB7]|nr:hypothetical protein [Gilliamella apicola]